jgi:hypothetical protein
MFYRHAISSLLLAAFLPACASYQATTQSVVELAAPPKPAERLRVWTVSGERFAVWAPQVVRDTLHGADRRPSADARQLAIPVSSIESVEVYDASSGSRVAGQIVAAGAAVALIAVIVEFSQCFIMCTD